MLREGIETSVLLAFIGFSAGGIIAAGVFAFLAIIGVYPRLIGATHTHRHILLYETLIILGGTLGNVVDLYEFPIPTRIIPSGVIFGMFGMAVGCFVGCLAMSLAETLKAVPVIARRIHLTVGLPYLILSVAVGKAVGSVLYFYFGMAAD